MARVSSRTPKLVIITGPSGVGKDTLARVLLRRVRKLRRVQTTTTRPRLPNDTRYRFVDAATFRRNLAAGRFLEATRVYGLWYGTERAALARVRRSGAVPFLILDPIGARKVKRMVPSALTVFIRPPTVAELRRRLLVRHRDDLAHVTRRIRVAKTELRLRSWDAEIRNETGRAASAASELIHTVRRYLAG